MSKISTKLTSLALATAVLGSGFSGNASATELESQVQNDGTQEIVEISTQENVGLNEVGPGVGDPNEIVPYGTSKPTSTWDLSTQGRYTFSGYLNSVRDLYTNYLLTGKSSAEIYIWNNDTTRLRFKVMQKNLLFDSQIGPTYELAAGATGTVNVSLDASKNYYIVFQGPCDVGGWIQ
ncbi:hypothetical protein [Sporosarcina sp. Te-1]|uniref:hypothetical protein n=1 Tax=Sporosarcina sp. Te-1 TaxID=2818390 RepID=UPI001A9FE76C|nr:hypothetical protein [Sporosarcina sp. Te-1]QTD40355.1 hypothetical protein J3U78_16445 [Sporosarcina sp. Te-1]